MSEGGNRVLLVDPSAVARAVGRRILEQLGYEVTSVEGGTEAVAAAAQEAYEAVLLSLHLVGMSGYDTARAIRALGGPTASGVIIGIGSSADDGLSERCRQCGMDSAVSSPLNRGLLETVLPQPVAPDDDDPAGHSPPLNEEHLREISDNDPEFESELLELFAEESQRRLRELRAGADAGNLEQVHRAAHALKGSAGNIGAEPLHEACADLQERTRDSGGSVDDGIIEAVERELERVLAALERRGVERG